MDAIGRKIGEIKINELNASREQLVNVTGAVKKLDRFVFDFKNDFEDFQETQQGDNEALLDFARGLVAAIKNNDLEVVNAAPEINNIEVRPEPGRRRGGIRKPAAPARKVKFRDQQGDSEDDDDDVQERLAAMRRRRK